MGIYRINFIDSGKSTALLFTYYQLRYLTNAIQYHFVNNISSRGLLTLWIR